mgnify:CR=1 FL=1
MKELSIWAGIPNWVDLAQLIQLEALHINEEVNREDEEKEYVDVAFDSLCNLRILSVPVSMFANNLPKYVISKCSPHLEVLQLRDLVPVKHVMHLLDGTWANEEDDSDMDEEDGDEEEEEEEEEEGDFDGDEVEKERDKKWKELKKGWKAKRSQKRKPGAHPGLKRIEIAYERDENCFDPSCDLFEESNWNDWYAEAISSVKQRAPSIRLGNVVSRVSATFIKEL